MREKGRSEGERERKNGSVRERERRERERARQCDRCCSFRLVAAIANMRGTETEREGEVSSTAGSPFLALMLGLMLCLTTLI